MLLLRWLSSWFLISEETFKVHQKDTLDLAIHSSCLQALHDRGCLREFKATSPPWRSPPPQPSRCLRGMLSLATRGLKHYKNLTWQTFGRLDECTDSATARLTGMYHAFAAPPPPPPRDWHEGPFPSHGEVVHGLSLTMRPTGTASPLCLFSPQWPETWLSPGSCKDILARFEVCFQKFG